MGGVWQLQDAKNRFSEVVEKALNNGPQIITRRGVETAVVLSVSDYRRLATTQGNLSDFLLSSPLADLDLDLQRDHSPLRPDLDL